MPVCVKVCKSVFALPVYMGSSVLSPSGSDRENSQPRPSYTCTQLKQQYPQPRSAAGQTKGLEGDGNKGHVTQILCIKVHIGNTMWTLNHIRSHCIKSKTHVACYQAKNIFFPLILAMFQVIKSIKDISDVYIMSSHIPFYPSNRVQNILSHIHKQVWCGCTLRRGYALPWWRLALGGHGEQSWLCREAVFCIIIHQAIFVQTGGHWDMVLQTYTQTHTD